MSKIIPNTYSKIHSVNYQGRSPGRANDWVKIPDQQNGLWSFFSAAWGGYYWDPAFQTTSGTYTQENENSGTQNHRDLDMLPISGIADRVKNNGQYEVGFIGFAQDLDLEIQFINIDQGHSTIATLGDGVSGSGTIEDWVDLTPTAVGDGAGGLGLVYTIIKARTNATTGTLTELTVGERIITSTTKLPDGT